MIQFGRAMQPMHTVPLHRRESEQQCPPANASSPQLQDQGAGMRIGSNVGMDSRAIVVPCAVPRRRQSQLVGCRHFR